MQAGKAKERKRTKAKGGHNLLAHVDVMCLCTLQASHWLMLQMENRTMSAERLILAPRVGGVHLGRGFFADALERSTMTCFNRAISAKHSSRLGGGGRGLPRLAARAASNRALRSGCKGRITLGGLQLALLLSLSRRAESGRGADGEDGRGDGDGARHRALRGGLGGGPADAEAGHALGLGRWVDALPDEDHLGDSGVVVPRRIGV